MVMNFLTSSRETYCQRSCPLTVQIVILDNCSVHHVSGVASMITEVDALVHFLPPYSPDLNPIEECFSKVKSLLKSMETTYQDDLETDI